MLIPSARKSRSEGYLDGHFLVAMPHMPDQRFARSVVYVCAHSAEGAMGIIVNQRAPELDFVELLVQLGIVAENDAIQLPKRAAAMQVLRGGPVESGRGFVLHSADYFIDSATLPIDEGVCLTHTLDILKAIARGDGPKQALLALGYAGWGRGQLDSEIQRNDWLHCPATPDLVFDTEFGGKYDRVVQRIGIDLGKLSPQAGHA
jgi:putative transcriptional regulator